MIDRLNLSDEIVQSQVRSLQWLHELERLQDRELALVAAAMIEECLKNLLISNMPELSSKNKKEIFEGYGPLSTFASKVGIAHAFGLISCRIKSNINSIKSIRNRFAHSLDKQSFDENYIAEICSRINLIDPEAYIEEAKNLEFTKSEDVHLSAFDIVIVDKYDQIFAGIPRLIKDGKSSRRRFINGVSIVWMLISHNTIQAIVKKQNTRKIADFNISE